MWVLRVWQTPVHPSDICRALPVLLHGARVTAEVLQELRGFWESSRQPKKLSEEENWRLLEGVPPGVQNRFALDAF